MKLKILIFLLSFFLLMSCKTQQKITFSFLDEYIVPPNTKIKNTFIGGLSGIDFANNQYYIVVDDALNPRFLKAKINIKKDKITSINFTDVVFLKDATTSFYTKNALDLESIFVDEKTQKVYFTSEGKIYKNKNPLVFSTDASGKRHTNYSIPDMFLANSNSKPVNNATFEGSSKSVNGNGFWVAMEAPLEIDGEEATIIKKSTPIRITYFDKKTQTATRQFAYQLENITKPVKGKFNVNGLTAILEYKKNHFFIVERTYQSGYGSYGNIVRIFNAVIDKNTTNILDVKSLKEAKYTPIKKELILNLEDIQSKLTNGIIDNIEGITFGPRLANGKQSLILVSDDNFQKYDKQLNQFILLKVDFGKN